jgi:hypothetical protein
VDGRWAPEGELFVTVTCERITPDFGIELTSEALRASASLRTDVGAAELDDLAVDRPSRSSSWGSQDTAVAYRFTVPVDASTATFTFEGHAYVPESYEREAATRAFSPAVSRDIPLR